jgi:hypothetical protein
MLQPHLSSFAHAPAPAWVRDQLAIGFAALLSMGVLWFGSGAVQHLATQGVVGATRVHTTMGDLSGSTEAADYGMTFDHVIAPMRTDVAASIRSIRIEVSDLMPLPWGKGYL